MFKELETAHAELSAAISVLEGLKGRRWELDAERAALELEIGSATNRLTRASTEVQRLEREPEDRAELALLTERLRAAIRKAPARSPSAARARELLERIESGVSSFTTAGALEAVREAVRLSERWYIIDRNVWDSRVPPLAGR